MGISKSVYWWLYFALRGRTLLGHDLTGWDLSDLDLRGVDFTEAMLRSADLSGCTLRKCTLKGADLKYADLEGCRIWDTDLSLIDGEGLHMAHSEIAYSTLEQSNLAYANLSGARLVNVDLRGCNLLEVDMTGAWLVGCDLRHAKVDGITWEGVILRGTRFTHAPPWEAMMKSQSRLVGIERPKQLPQPLFLETAKDILERLGYAGNIRRRLVEEAWRQHPELTTAEDLLQTIFKEGEEA